MGTATTTVTDESFATEVLGSSVPVVVDFWAEWCGPCRAVAPVLEEIAAGNAGKVRVAKLNVDENQATASSYGVLSLPTLLVFKNGEVVKQIVGAKGKAALLGDLEDIL